MRRHKPLTDMTCQEAENASAANLEAWTIASNTTDPAEWDAGYTLYVNKEVEIKEARFGHGVGHPRPRPR